MGQIGAQLAQLFQDLGEFAGIDLGGGVIAGLGSTVNETASMLSQFTAVAPIGADPRRVRDEPSRKALPLMILVLEQSFTPHRTHFHSGWNKQPVAYTDAVPAFTIVVSNAGPVTARSSVALTSTRWVFDPGARHEIALPLRSATGCGTSFPVSAGRVVSVDTLRPAGRRRATWIELSRSGRTVGDACISVTDFFSAHPSPVGLDLDDLGVEKCQHVLDTATHFRAAACRMVGRPVDRDSETDVQTALFENLGLPPTPGSAIDPATLDALWGSASASVPDPPARLPHHQRPKTIPSPKSLETVLISAGELP